MTNQGPGSEWTVIGALGAIAIGIALIPFRTLTVASNLAFVFLIYTIVMAEFGGRQAGLTTAVVSALSLNFFLTEPYLTLAINKPDDIVAFVALGVSGLIAAAFGRQRAHASSLVGEARHDLEALKQVAEGLNTGAPLETVLEDLRRSFRLGGLVLRYADGRLVSAAPPGYADRSVPVLELEPHTLLAAGEQRHRLGQRGFRLPEGGGRVRLGVDREFLWLDLWEGDEGGLSVNESRALVVAIAMLRLSVRPEPTLSASPHRRDQ